MTERPDVGDPAPFFSAPVAGGAYDDGDIVALSDLKGESVVLYFYPNVKPAEHVDQLLTVLE